MFAPNNNTWLLSTPTTASFSSPFANLLSLSSLWDDDNRGGALWNSNNVLATDKVVQPHAYTYKFDMPGFRAENIELEVERETKTLTVKGRHQHQEEQRQNQPGSYSYSLRSMGDVYKSLPLDSDTIAEPHRVQAHLDNGVLSVTLPRRPPPPPSRPSAQNNSRRIPIIEGPRHTSTAAAPRMFVDMTTNRP